MHSVLTRREMGAGLVVALIGGSAVASVPLFADIRKMNVPGDVRRISTAGHGRHGVGAATYRRCASAAETRYRVHSADGACWQLAGSEVSPEQVGAAGDGATDDHEALMAAQSLSRPLALTPGRAYRVGATLELSIPVHGSGAIVTAPGFRGDVLIHAKPGFHLRDVTLDGAGMAPAPKAWLGVGAPSGSGIYLEGTDQAPMSQTVIENITLRNMPGGGLMAKYAPGIRIRGVQAQNVQANAALPSSAVIELYHCDGGEIRDCSIRGFRWKGYALDACRGTAAIRCVAEGGNPGHAAHYVDGSEDSGYIDCSHRSAGYAAKASNSVRPYYRRYRSNNSAGGVYFQACKDFTAEDCVVTDSDGAAFIVSASTVGPSEGGELLGVKASWSDAAPTGKASAAARRVGLLLTCNNATASAITGLRVRGLSIERPFFGVQIMPAPGNPVDARLESVKITDAAQYGVIAYVRSLTVEGASAITGQGAFPAIAIYSNSGVAGGSIVLDGLRMSGSDPGVSMVEIGAETGRPAAFSSLTLSHNASDGGRELLSARLSGAAPGALVKINLRDNSAKNLTGPAGADITLAPGVQGAVSATGNRFDQIDGQPAALNLSPRSAFTSSDLASTGDDAARP